MIFFFFGIFLISFLMVKILHSYHKRKKKRKSFLYYSGLLHLIMGILLLPGYTVLIGIGLVLIGVIFLWIGKRTFFQKHTFYNINIWNYIAMIPTFCLLIFLLYWEPPFVKILIPYNYKGRILIVHNCENEEIAGEKEREFLYKRVYRINSDGILYTPFSYNQNHDMNRLEFFYTEKTGDLEPLEQYRDGFYNIENAKNWDNAKVYYGFLTNPNKNHPVMSFIVEDKVFNPEDYKIEEIPLWQERMKKCE